MYFLAAAAAAIFNAILKLNVLAPFGYVLFYLSAVATFSAHGMQVVAFSGIALLTLVAIYLFQLRFTDTQMIEFGVSLPLGCVLFYLGAVAIFSTLMCLVWQKVVSTPSADTRERYHSTDTHSACVKTASIARAIAELYHAFKMSENTRSLAA